MKNLAAVIAVSLFAACGPQQQNQLAPEFQVGGGQNGSNAPYPTDPTGVGIGSVVPNFQFLGFPRANVDRTTLVQMELADFYNPTGTDVYPPGSPYGAGQPKPLALALDRSAVWCGPCNQEAKTVLPPLHTKYFPKGDFLLVLSESATPGTLATQTNLNVWTGKYAVDYPAVLDPNAFLSTIVGADAYPGNVIVRTRDMKIVTWVGGEPAPSYWATFEKVLAGLPVLPGDS